MRIGLENLPVLETAVANGSLKPFVTGTFPLDRADEALAIVESGHATGKIVIELA